MPLFLLHDIFPKDAPWFVILPILAMAMLLPILGKLITCAAIVGALVVTRATGLVRWSRLLHHAVREGRRPTVAFCLAVLLICALTAAMMLKGDVAAMLASGILLSGPVPMLFEPGHVDSGAGMAGFVIMSVVVTTMYWVLAATGVRALWSARRERRAARVANGRAAGNRA